ncbi:CA-responsive protein [Trifolium repens]|nr:CA-responsive protein [Trifolium repens]
MQNDPIFSLSFILPFIIIFISSSSVILTLFLSFLRKPPPLINPKPDFTPHPDTHDPTTDSQQSQLRQSDQNNLTPNLVSDTASPDSAKLIEFFEDDPNPKLESGQGELKKKKKRKTKKKNMMMITKSENEIDDDKSVEVEREQSDLKTRPESIRLDPFTSSSSAMQKKIKPQYDELVKCNESKKLTLSQVVQFANSLVDARSELQHKADATRRKFVITKALLYKADRSSFDRLQQQIYKLELEQKRLEEDAFVYNWLQQQLKLSPAYNKMLEIGVSMEKEKSCKMGEIRDDELCDISFEELLAQEKKDTFWQRNAKSRQCSS